MDAVLKPMLSDPHVNPQRAVRVASSTGARNLERSRGSLSLCQNHVSPVVSMQQPVRIASSSGARNLERGRGSLSLFQNDDDGSGERQTDGGVSFVVDFPAGDCRPPTRPPRLVGKVAAAAAERNVGCMANLLNVDANRDYQDPQPRQKLRSQEAKDIAARYTADTAGFCLNHERNQGYSSARGPNVPSAVGREALERSRGVVGIILAAADNDDYASPRPMSRVLGAEAEYNAQRDTGAGVRQALDRECNTGYQSPIPASRAVHGEVAQDNAARGKGEAVSRLMSYDDMADTSPRPEPRVRPEARDAATKNRGTFALSMDDQPASDPVHEARVKGIGKDNYDRDRQGTVNQLLSDNQSASSRPASRTRMAGAYCQNGQGTVHKLFYDYGQLPQSARPAPRVRSEARPNAIRNMGTMSDFL